MRVAPHGSSWAISSSGDAWLLQGVSYHIQNGAHLSKATVKFFKHNDMADLERVMREVDAEYRRLR
jgi:serine palmitoyltransferase